MSRDIKFRAWNDVDKAMIPFSTLTAQPKLLVDIMRGRIKYHKLMQYTGLKDANGVEIYEGDVVYIGGYGDYEVEFPFIELYEAVMENDIGEIKGNIHQNPELLGE